MKIAVLCFVHKDPYLVNTLVEQFLSVNKETDVYIHLDKKSESIKHEIVSNPHVFFIKKNVSVTWGNDTMMKAMIFSLDEIFALNRDYDSFIICTGQDLIVRKGLDEFLEKNRDNIYLDAKDGKDNYYRKILSHRFPRFLCKDIYHHAWYHPLRLIMAFYHRLIKYNLLPSRNTGFNVNSIKFYYSFNWSIMPYYVIKDCFHSFNENIGLKQLYFDTFLPEDAFLATIVMNSKYAGQVQWASGNKTYTQTFHSPIHIHPKVFTVDDINEISESNCFFARKFDSLIDREVINYYKKIIL